MKIALGLVLLSTAMGLYAKTAELKLYPPEVRVHASDTQRVLLLATDEQGVTREVTAEAAWKLTDESATFSAPRSVRGVKPGAARLIASFDGRTAEVPVETMAERKHELSFINDIVPIFTKSDCANSNCHGSIRGQKGFKLSLFGSDPELDYQAITKKDEGRRVNRTEVAKSLVLQKPTFEVPHGGGPRFKVGSPEYQLMLEWLSKGAPYDAPGQARLRTLSVYPPKQRMVGLGSTLQLIAVGEYND